jgi:hypothetical protein
MTTFLFYACSSAQLTSDRNSIEQMINQVMDNWHLAAAQANMDAYFNKIAENGIYVGTDAKEVWTKHDFLEFARPYFEKGTTWDFKTINRNIYLSKDNRMVWFDETLNTWMGTCRGSGILVFNQLKKQYLIQHYVLSMCIPNDDVQSVIELINQD